LAVGSAKADGTTPTPLDEDTEKRYEKANDEGKKIFVKWMEVDCVGAVF
jgi:hypothetical protein